MTTFVSWFLFAIYTFPMSFSGQSSTCHVFVIFTILVWCSILHLTFFLETYTLYKTYSQHKGHRIRCISRVVNIALKLSFNLYHSQKYCFSNYSLNQHSCGLYQGEGGEGMRHHVGGLIHVTRPTSVAIAGLFLYLSEHPFLLFYPTEHYSSI